MEILFKVFAVIAAYLIGSIATSVWIGKLFYGIDVREHGSGNAGATNTFRVLGKKAGIPVFILDVLKSYAAAYLVLFFPGIIEGTSAYVNLQLLFGFTAVLGHIFPVYVGFKGGKGVASLLGLTLAIAPEPAITCFVVFLMSLMITKYVSVSSMIAGICFPVLVIAVFKIEIISLMYFSVIFAVLLIVTHKKNIKRLLQKEENKTYLFKFMRP